MRQELLNMEGVVAAEVSYDDKLATVRYEPDRVTTEEMIAAIDATGFNAALLEPAPDDS